MTRLISNKHILELARAIIAAIATAKAWPRGDCEHFKQHLTDFTNRLP